MNFSPIHYLNWAKTSFHGDGDAIDLATSGFPARDIDDLSPTPEQMAIRAPNAYGWAPLKESIGHHHGLTEDEVVITAGASMANFLTLMSLVQPGTNVLVEDPAYEPMRNLPGLFGGQAHSLKRDGDKGWSLSPERLEERLKETRARVVFISNPHNPSGVMLPAPRIMALVEVASKYKATLVLDEVYAEFHPWDAAELSSATRAGHLIRISSLTKVFGFGPLRVGWILASKAKTRELLELTNYTYASHGAINERLGMAVWEQRDRFREEARRRASFNLDVVRSFLSTQSRLQWTDPKAGILGFLKIDGLKDTTPFTKTLLEDYGVMVVPGSFFDDPSRIRFGYGNESGKVRVALQRLGKALQTL